MLDATAGPLSGDPYVAVPPSRPYLDEVAAPPGRLRIGYARSAPSGVPLHADCIAAVDDAARLCESLGHHVEEASPQYDAIALRDDFGRVFAAHTMANVARATGGPLPGPGLLEPLTHALAERGNAIGAAQFIGAVHALHRQSRRIAAFFERFDLWLTPTLAQPPMPVGHFQIESGDVDAWLARLDAFLPFTYPFNITGSPAMSVPLFWSADALPIGCQFAARYGDEALLFRLAGQLEQARPWFDRRPPVPPTAAGELR
jgi:amidase